MALRRVEEKVDEIETIIMVRPEFVDGMDPHEVPAGGPGTDTVSPTDMQLFMRGHIEVPRCCTDRSCSKCRAADAEPGDIVLPPSGPIPVDVTRSNLLTSAPLYRPAVRLGPSQAVQRLPRQPDVQSVRSPRRPVTNSAANKTLARPNPRNRTSATRPQNRAISAPILGSNGLIGPVGYDVKQ